jgi:hypothetical protein
MCNISVSDYIMVSIIMSNSMLQYLKHLCTRPMTI